MSLRDMWNRRGSDWEAESSVSVLAVAVSRDEAGLEALPLSGASLSGRESCLARLWDAVAWRPWGEV
jgi:hypothetical protein